MTQTVNVISDEALLWGGNAVNVLTGSTVQLVNTGGYPRITPSIEQVTGGTKITQTCTSSSTTNIGGALFAQKVDLTNVNSIKWIAEGNSLSRVNVAVSLTGTDGSAVLHKGLDFYTLDVSSLSGEYYIGLQCEAPTPVGTSIVNTIKQLWCD